MGTSVERVALRESGVMRRRVCEGPGCRLGGPAVLTALVIGLVLCGCSQPLLMFRGDRPPPVAEDAIVTGSIERRPMSFGDDLAEEDWRRARAALSVALDPQGNGRPVKWDNPETGLKGSVNPTGLPYVADDLICRNFLASVINASRSRFVRGTGCKMSGGEWSLKRVRSAIGPAARPE